MAGRAIPFLAGVEVLKGRAAARAVERRHVALRLAGAHAPLEAVLWAETMVRDAEADRPAGAR